MKVCHSSDWNLFSLIGFRRKSSSDVGSILDDRILFVQGNLSVVNANGIGQKVFTIGGVHYTEVLHRLSIYLYTMHG